MPKGPKPKPLAERFWPKVDRRSPSECWPWKAARNGLGYGVCMVGVQAQPRQTFSHRVSWMLHHGDVPPGLLVLHKCDNPPCVNPAHLFLGTDAANHLDMRLKGRAPRLKLTEQQVREIRERHAAGETQTALGPAYGVRQCNISDIVLRKTWKHIIPALLFAFASTAQAQDAPTVPAPVSGPAPASVSIVAGTIVSMGGGATAGVRPLAAITFNGPVADTEWSPRLVAGVDLGALPGQALDLSSPATFRSLAFRVTLVQPIPNLFVAPYVGGGFATRVETDPEPMDRTARWWSAGLRIAGSRGWLELGAGLDDRLGDGYQPTAHARGALLMGDRAGINAWLIGEAILGLRIGYAGTEGRVDVVTIGLGVGR